MTTSRRKTPANEARQELRTAAKAIGFELRQLTRAVQEVRDRAEAIKLRLYTEARTIRQASKTERKDLATTRDAITVLHGPEGRSTRRGHD
jgi:hypothetical protein